MRLSSIRCLLHPSRSYTVLDIVHRHFGDHCLIPIVNLPIHVPLKQVSFIIFPSFRISAPEEEPNLVDPSDHDHGVGGRRWG